MIAVAFFVNVGGGREPFVADELGAVRRPAGSFAIKCHPQENDIQK